MLENVTLAYSIFVDLDADMDDNQCKQQPLRQVAETYLDLEAERSVA